MWAIFWSLVWSLSPQGLRSFPLLVCALLSDLANPSSLETGVVPYQAAPFTLEMSNGAGPPRGDKRLPDFCGAQVSSWPVAALGMGHDMSAAGESRRSIRGASVGRPTETRSGVAQKHDAIAGP
jgi:hypothetical protein